MLADLNTLDAVNLGFGGGTNASGIHYIDTLLTPLKPAKVVLYFGENDISNDGLCAASTFENIKALLAEIETRLPNIPIFVLSAKQSATRWFYADVVTQYNGLLEEHCSDATNLTYVNVTDALLGEHGRPTGGLYVDDGVHLNLAGYDK
jgi:lysophospholipase L1-like esterase